MTEQELKEELRQDMLNEARQDEAIEHKLRTDWDYVLDRITTDRGFSAIDLSEELQELLSKINELGWDVSYKDIIGV